MYMTGPSNGALYKSNVWSIMNMASQNNGKSRIMVRAI